MTTALLLVDTQVNMFEPRPAHGAAELLAQLERLVTAARTVEVPIVFIRNNGGPDDPDYPGRPGWEIHPRLAPMPGELVVDKWEANAFSERALGEFLEELGVDKVVVAGLQSEFCVRETSAGALRSHLDLVLIADGHSTFDSDDPAQVTIDSINSEFQTLAQVLTTDDVIRAWEG